MWEKSNLYAVLIQQDGNALNTITLVDNAITPLRVDTLSAAVRESAPSSNQIRSAMDRNNEGLGKYRHFTSTTDSNGVGRIFFDDLQPGKNYDMYVTASSIIPYAPTFLWTDSEVLKVSFTTLYNQALKNQDINTDELRRYKPKLADAIERFQKNQEKKDAFEKLTRE
jgi:hypothetical protein